ncbi:hypothetical protein FRC04_004570 [Tulasnella sp. 424]|nr:hypothetical protein FRC04_004570 [Tulasnella sp. 424]KAG8976639.1 hypothetical protein FRC05_003478 [Tulasnella sp. 425]
MTEPARARRLSQEGQSDSHSRPTTAGDNSQQYADYPSSGYDFLSLDPNIGQHPPATPPYRRMPTASTTDVRAMPPDYRSEYNVSREHVGSNDGAGTSRANLVDEKSDYPREKESLDDDERRDEHEPPSQYNTATTGKSVHYPDTDGIGRLLHDASRPTQTGMPPRPVPSRQSSYAGSDMDEDEDEMYDWSDEEDLVDEEAKFHKSIGQGEKKRGFGFFRFLTFFFSTLIGSTVLTGALVAAAICVRLFWLKPHWSEHREWVTDNIQAWLFWAAANVLVSWWLASIIDILPHIFSFLVVIVWGTLSENMKSKLELYQTGKGWIKPLFYAAGSWVSWVILFEGVFDLYDGKDEGASKAHYTPRVYQVIRFLFFLVLVVCLEKMLIQMIAFSFHRTAFQERLDDVTKATKVLDHLRDYKPKRRTPGGSGTHTPLFFGGRQRYASEPGAMEEGFINGADAADDERDARRSDSPAALPPRKKRGFWDFSSGSGSGRSKPKRKDSNIPLQDSPTHAYPPSSSRPASGPNSPTFGSDGRRTSGVRHSREVNPHDSGEAVIMQAAKALKKVALHDARGMRRGGDDEDGGGEGVFSLNTAHEAKKLARNLYYAFRSDRRRQYLIPSDFYPAYASAEEARDAFRVFDKDDNGDITRAEIKTATLKVYKERRFLARSLRDVGAAVKTLDNLMLCVFLIILIFIALPIFGVSITSSFSSIYTVFIAASFIFKNAASNAFDSIMFLFVTHPFDTGDRCFIENENLVVRKMGLFATTFTRADGSQTYYFNSMLLNKFIMNARRSDKMGEVMELQVNWRTPQWKFDALEKKLNEWIDQDEKRWYKSQTSVSFSKIEFQKALVLSIGIGHNGTWQDWTMRLARKTAFHAAVQYFTRQLEITCSESPQPVIFAKPESKYPHLDESQIDEPYTPLTPRTPHTPHSPMVPNAPAVPSDLHREHAMLGFTPPQGQNQLRQRKGNKKKLMGATDADG